METPDAAVITPACTYDGEEPRWDPVPSPVTEDLCSVFALSASDAWIVGANGTILRFNGEEWILWQSLGGESLGSLWMADASDGWATAFDRLVRFNGMTWERYDGVLLTEFGTFSALWGASRNDVWLGGGSVSPQRQVIGHWDGANWTLAYDVTEQPISVNSLHGSAADSAWGVMQLGRLMRLRNGAWVHEPGPDPSAISSVHVINANEAWFGALYGYVHHWRGGMWETFRPGGDSTYHYAVWAGASDNVWTLGWEGAAAHYDGVNWTNHVVSEQTLFAVHGTCETGVWAVGADGTILRLNLRPAR